jgi:hypothetical protein
MAKIPKFTLGYDKAQEEWQLKNGSSNVQTFDKRSYKEAPEKVGAGGGLCRFSRWDVQQRTYPRSATRRDRRLIV